MSKIKIDSILDKLGEILKKKTIILGVGNTLRCDDGFGSVLAKRLKGRIVFKVFDAGVAPENLFGSIIKEGPEVVLIIDAVDFGAAAASLRLFDMDDVQTKNFFSTHNISLNLFHEFLKNGADSRTYLLAVQPERTAFGEKMSAGLNAVLEDLEGWFTNRYPVCTRG